jgi:hypothetical protein
MTQPDLFAPELAAAQAAYRRPPDTPTPCAAQGCGELALPDSRYCVECDELPEDYYALDDSERFEAPVPVMDRQTGEWS